MDEQEDGGGMTLTKSPMGIAVRASLCGPRAGGGLAAGAVRDDAGQDEGHAGDAEQVRRCSDAKPS